MRAIPGRSLAAGWKLFENNPLTTVCSLVCNHERQCEGNCVRGLKGSPVHFSVIENYISTTFANKMVKGPAKPNGMKTAIVGSGPAGLTIAVLLARWGYDVTIFEARDKIGGMMRYGIPNFRLPDAVLDDFQYRHLQLKDIKVRTNTTIGKTITIDDLFRDGYNSVFIGAGLWKANAMHVKGESLGNVAFGIDYLANPSGFKSLGSDIAVIGVGNSAMDCARTAIRNGARHVTCYGRHGEDGATTRAGVFAGGDAVAGARTVVEAVAGAKKVAEAMDAYMKSLPKDETPDPYANIPVFDSPTPDVFGEQKV